MSPSSARWYRSSVAAARQIINSNGWTRPPGPVGVGAKGTSLHDPPHCFWELAQRLVWKQAGFFPHACLHYIPSGAPRAPEKSTLLRLLFCLLPEAGDFALL